MSRTLFLILSFLSCHNAFSLSMSCSRRELIGWVGAATAFPSICNAVGDDGRVDVDSYLASGGVSMPMGVSGQAGKAKPVTGVILRDGSEVLRDTRTGDVSAEIIVSGPGGNTPVLASYSSPWSLAKGMVFDVECRDARTGDGAFLSVSQPVGGKNIDQLKDSFILTNLLKPNGRFSFYGEPTDVKVKASEMKDNYRIIDLSFSALSQATQTEIPRRARVAATIPEGSDQAVILVASASAIQWKKGSDKAIASTIESFRAVPAPRSDMKVRSK